MTSYPRTDVELQADINNKMSVVVQNVTEYFLAELQDIILTNVYSAYEPVEYSRTGEFANSWTNDLPIIIGNIVTSIIYQNVFAMNIETVNTRFLNKTYTKHEDRENLASIIESGLGYNYYPENGNLKARPFWNEFENLINSKLVLVIEKEMKKVGL